jgi:hypothetical protein
MAKTINLSELARELGAESDSQLEDLKQATLLGIAKSIPYLVENSPVDTGLYAQSWDFKKEEWGAVLGNYAPHSPMIEYGARPFTPPLKPLLAWAKRVLQDPSQPPNYSSDVWRLAKYTQSKIAREGMKPRAVMENAIPQIIENIKAEYQRIGT